MTEEPTPTPRESAGLPRIAVVISGTGTLLQALLDHTSDPADTADPAPSRPAGFTVSAVLSDRPGAPGLARARAAGVATAVVDLADFPDRASWDEAFARAVDVFHPDLVVCAGFMRIFGDPMLRRYGGRIVNTHPALLPSFPGAHGVRDALAHGVKITGCTVILVDAGIDSGPIVGQRAVEVLDEDDEGTLHERIKIAERELLVDVVGRMVRNGWTVEGRKVILR